MSTVMTVPRPPDTASRGLFLLFLFGIYLGVAARLPGGIPLPAVLAGMAGCLLLLAQSSRIRERHIAVLFAVLILYALSILSAPDYGYLIERFKGLVQLSYSLVIGYAFFLTATRYDRSRLASIFLSFSIVILIGCVLENYTPFKAVSDTFRGLAFESGVYASDLRDQIFYGRVRPKLFTSEPSALTFVFTLFTFAWYVLCRAKYKIFWFLFLSAAGYFLMRGPTIMIGLALVPAYELLLASRRGMPGRTRMDSGRAAGAVILTVIIVGAAIPLIQVGYAARVEAILSGQDPSFFARVIAPPLVAFKVLSAHPFAGAGLTGWEFIEGPTSQVYANAQWFSSNYRFDGAANAITNYFWLHWIFLGLAWGGAVLVALSVLLRSLGVPSLLFCWIVWAAFGQSAGSYVGPQAWTVMFLAGALAVVHERGRVHDTMRRAAVTPSERHYPRLTIPPAATEARS